MVSVMPASRYVTSASRYQSKSSMYIQGLIPCSSTELAEAVPIVRMRTIGDCVRTSWSSWHAFVCSLFLRKISIYMYR